MGLYIMIKVTCIYYGNASAVMNTYSKGGGGEGGGGQVTSMPH